uniref:plasmid mobilization relaxosome protein MobC n=1 Tax=Pedobacter sp. TaxID=1411316 RepID=UPI0015976DEE|nr:plasmid mobilization relaxosome protein MobC [Pedobacter sp.]QJS06233.1 mobilization protein, MobC [Pedobacter sp.]
MSRNKGGRPQKHEGKKIKQAHLRLTEDQHSQLSKIEVKTGINRTDLFVKRVLENQEFIVTKDLFNQLSSIGGEIGKVGNNINQIAKHANTIIKNHDLPPEILSEFMKMMSVFTERERELYKVFKQLYKLMKT